MSALASMTIANWPAMLKGLVEAQKMSLRFMRQELKRGAGRIRKKFIREQLHGAPGIKAGPLAKGKNIWTYVQGDSHKTLGAKIGISRILHVHEKGLTITPTRGELLYIHEKGTGPRKNRPIVAAVPQVKIPARLQFRKLVAAESPATLRKVGEAGSRGIEVSLKKALAKSI